MILNTNENRPIIKQLKDLPLGVKAILGRPSCFNTTVLRLIEMGLVPGTPIQVVRRTSTHGPLQIRLRGANLCLRADEACLFAISP